MVRLEEVEDETFVEKSESSRDDVLLADDDADYTDTGKQYLRTHQIIAGELLASLYRSELISHQKSPSHLNTTIPRSIY